MRGSFDVYMKPIQDAVLGLTSAFGKDAVYQNIELVGGKKSNPKNGNSRLVDLPMDTETMEGSKVQLRISTGVKGFGFTSPEIWVASEKEEDTMNLTHPDYLGEKKETLKQNVLTKLGKLQEELNKKYSTK
jgi:hypothetical protein